MKSADKTRKTLLEELEALRARVSELEKREKDSRQPPGNYGERTERTLAQLSHMHEAVFVIFDRKLEFVNDRFADFFNLSPEEACSSGFDPMTLIAPEDRRDIRELYREGCCGAFTTKQLNFTGLSKDGPSKKTVKSFSCSFLINGALPFMARCAASPPAGAPMMHCTGATAIYGLN